MLPARALAFVVVLVSSAAHAAPPKPAVCNPASPDAVETFRRATGRDPLMAERFDVAGSGGIVVGASDSPNGMIGTLVSLDRADSETCIGPTLDLGPMTEVHVLGRVRAAKPDVLYANGAWKIQPRARPSIGQDIVYVLDAADRVTREMVLVNRAPDLPLTSILFRFAAEPAFTTVARDGSGTFTVTRAGAPACVRPSPSPEATFKALTGRDATSILRSGTTPDTTFIAYDAPNTITTVVYITGRGRDACAVAADLAVHRVLVAMRRVDTTRAFAAGQPQRGLVYRDGWVGDDAGFSARLAVIQFEPSADGSMLLVSLDPQKRWSQAEPLVVDELELHGVAPPLGLIVRGHRHNTELPQSVSYLWHDGVLAMRQPRPGGDAVLLDESMQIIGDARLRAFPGERLDLEILDPGRLELQSVVRQSRCDLRVIGFRGTSQRGLGVVHCIEE